MPTLTLTIETETDGRFTPTDDSPLPVTIDGHADTDPVALTSRAIAAARFYRDHTGHPGNVRVRLGHVPDRVVGYALTPALPEDPTIRAVFTAAQGDGFYAATRAGEERAARHLMRDGLLAYTGRTRLPSGWISRYALTGPYEADYAIHTAEPGGRWTLTSHGTRRITDATDDAVRDLAENMTMWHSAAGTHDVRVTALLTTDAGLIEATAVRRALTVPRWVS